MSQVTLCEDVVGRRIVWETGFGCFGCPGTLDSAESTATVAVDVADDDDRHRFLGAETATWVCSACHSVWTATWIDPGHDFDDCFTEISHC